MLNKEALTKIVILISYAAFILNLLYTGRISMYVHPKMNTFVLFCALVFIIMAIINFGELFKKVYRRPRLSGYMFFIIPLLLALLIQPIALNSVLAQSRGMVINKSQTGINKEKAQNPVVNSETGDGNQPGSGIEIDGNRIIVTEKNYLTTLDALYLDYKSFEGLSIEISGFVFRDEGFGESNFVVARSTVSCCTADASVTGLLCEYPEAAKLRNDEWVRVKGVIQESYFEDEALPVIVVEAVEKITKPKDEYLFAN